MPRLTDVVADRATRLVTREVGVTAVTDLTQRFRRIDLAGGPLESVDWKPGQKLQVRIEGFTFRTYTPFAWGDDRVSLLTDRHGDGPASSWTVGLEVGDRCQAFGPRRSLDLSLLIDDPIVVGDDVVHVDRVVRRGQTTRSTVAELYEVTSVDEARAGLEGLGLGLGLGPDGLGLYGERLPGVTFVEREPDDGHLDRLSQFVCDAMRDHPAAPLVLTGQAQTIQRLRATLKAEGLAAPAVRVKAYWDVNRAGLD